MEKLKRFGQLAAVAALAAGVSLPAAALKIDFTNGSTTQVGTGFGNSVKFNIGSDFSMNAKGYSNTGTNGKLQTAEITKWNTGLGVCNRGEGLANTWQGCRAPSHQVDNYGYTDLIAFFFDQSVSFTSVSIDPYFIQDRDISYWVGNVSSGLSLSGTKYSELGGVGFGSRTDKNSYPSFGLKTYGLTGSGNALLVSASLTSGHDAFKLNSITIGDPDLGGDVTPVPLPAAAWLLMSGLAAYGFTARKRKVSV